ncbi:MAG: hypothetical protein JNL82_01770 [Myxococcales bacterium]|nr:hypothetical protein [Myxococcales bacterium]
MKWLHGVMTATLAAGCAAPAGDDDDGSGAQAGPDAGETAAEADTTANPTTAPTSDGGESGGEPVLRGACPLETKVGEFKVTLEDIYSAFSGVVADGVVPITVLETVGEEGGCRLLRRNNPVCDPPCQPGTTCDFSGECIVYPANHDVGTVTVTGLVQPVVVEPVMPTYDYFDSTLMHPACEPGSAIALTATGGDYAAFTLYGEGVAAIEPASEMLVMKKGQALALQWAAGAGAAHVRVDLTIDQHGNTPVKLICVGEDSGSMTVPESLIAQLIDFGISGFPSAQWYRETVDSTALAPGCVEFAVRSHRETLLGVEGHTPCNKPDDCPEGQICDILIQTCK